MTMHVFLLPIIIGIGAGLFTRTLMFQTTYRQYPSHPHGFIIQMFIAFIASIIGSLAVPAIFKPDFTAGVFISLGTAQFHTMRDLERKAWMDIDKGEVVPRGNAYIDGMASAFEARIFLVVGVALVTTVLSYTLHWLVGVVCGVILAVLLRVWKQGKVVRSFADVAIGEISWKGGKMVVDGLEIDVDPNEVDAGETGNSQLNEDIEPIAIVVKPKDVSGLMTFMHQGQQQAMLHNLFVAVGARTDMKPSPTAAYFPSASKLVLTLVPLLHNEEYAMEAVAGSPVLETVLRKSGA